MVQLMDSAGYVYLQVAKNNRADTAFAALRHGVSEYGLPSRVRTDRGGDNTLIYVANQGA